MSDHAVFSPSSAHRWIECPGSIELNKAFKDTSGRDAAIGTAAHELAADCLENGIGAKEQIGKFYNGVKVDEEMANGVIEYLEVVAGFVHADK